MSLLSETSKIKEEMKTEFHDESVKKPASGQVTEHEMAL